MVKNGLGSHERGLPAPKFFYDPYPYRPASQPGGQRTTGRTAYRAYSAQQGGQRTGRMTYNRAYDVQQDACPKGRIAYKCASYVQGV